MQAHLVKICPPEEVYVNTERTYRTPCIEDTYQISRSGWLDAIYRIRAAAA